MDTIIYNIKKIDTKGILSLEPLPCYYYNIQGIGVLLYDDPKREGPKYSTCEFFTGRHFYSADTMQEALNGATDIITTQGFEAVQEKITAYLGETGYANQP